MSTAQPAAQATVQAHLFCRVIDNHGDAGVCWRLARQLACEYGVAVALIMDQPAALLPLLGLAEREAMVQARKSDGVSLYAWQEVAQGSVTLPEPDLVIEAFACELSLSCLQRMQEQHRPPLWVNLEYLSAEDWVGGCHGLASVHPQTGLRKLFFFPGFTAQTGGLLREQGLLEAHAQWQSEAGGRAALLRDLGIAGISVAAEEMLLVSLFTYESAAVAGTLTALAQLGRPVLCLVPEGRVLTSLEQAQVLSARGQQVRDDTYQLGGLTLKVIPFLPQPDYDRLLSLCDLNLVRGEDSFVRAQWTGKPMLWHIYEQEDGAHLAKLDAFLNLYTEGMEKGLAVAVSQLWQAWNRGQDCRSLWGPVLENLPSWYRHARRWREKMAGQGDLASNLMNFYENKL
ncbi:MAG: elongation factor P maturation arginine rhamnosyltransferase EarP [Pseudomonadales bacterium]|nr:elongation factor P maturation arginine rhamnosyltransferase EarP [Pseudomonadales bacterium]